MTNSYKKRFVHVLLQKCSFYFDIFDCRCSLVVDGRPTFGGGEKVNAS